MGPDWVQRWLSFIVVADALARYRQEGEPVFELKGGAAIELRLRRPRPHSASPSVSTGVRPRATKDLDVTFRGEAAALQTAVEQALQDPHPEFRFRAELETPEATAMRRFRVRVSYLQRGIGGMPAPKELNSVKLEVSCYEGTPYPSDLVPAYSLKPFGIEGPTHLPCLPLPKQIAQKLHAVTETPDGDRRNQRFRDLVDIVMLSVLVPPSPELRTVCEETFQIRGRHGWPPAVIAHPEWIAPLEQRAVEMGLETTKAEEIVAFVQRYVTEIADAG